MKWIWKVQLFIIMLLLVSMPVYGTYIEASSGVIASGNVAGIQANGITSVIAAGTIQEAVDGVTAPGSTNIEIDLLNRVYRENIVIDKSLNIIGAGIGKSIVDGGGNGRVFTINPNSEGLAPTVTLKAMTIKNGKTDGDGGGILNWGTLTVENCDINNNYAGEFGGGISNYGDLMVLSSDIHHNTAYFDGGGIDSSAPAEGVPATATLKDSRVHHNTALIGFGGGIATYYEGGMLIDTCQIDHNNAIFGGGINVYADTLIKNSDIMYNTAVQGGGIFWDWGPYTLTLENSKIKYNIARDWAGGIYSAFDPSGFGNTIDKNLDLHLRAG